MPRHDIETLLVRSGERPDPSTGSVAPVLVRTKTYAQRFGEKHRWGYSRGGNPTREALEEKLAELDGGRFACAFSSGVAAEAMLFLTLNPGDHVVVPGDAYGGTTRLLEKVIARFGIKFTECGFGSEEDIRKAIKPETRLIFVESLTNPSLRSVDLSTVARVSKEAGVPFVVDSTFTPPCSLRPLEHGALAVLHSVSKYLAGHNDVIGGAIVTSDERLHGELKFLQRTVGAVLSPDECYRAIQGIKTLALRWRAASGNAQAVAEHLSRHPKIKSILYPGLKNHPTGEVAARQMKGGFGAVLSFEIDTGEGNLKAFVEKAQESGVLTYGESLASPETLLSYPYAMSHGYLSEEKKVELGISKTFFRLSCGLESAKDIIEALDSALGEV